MVSTCDRSKTKTYGLEAKTSPDFDKQDTIPEGSLQHLAILR